MVIPVDMLFSERYNVHVSSSERCPGIASVYKVLTFIDRMKAYLRRPKRVLWPELKMSQKPDILTRLKDQVDLLIFLLDQVG